MENYKQAFIEFMVDVGVLTFGDFTTKSGRKTPYFVNTGKYRTGAQLAQLSKFYADAILQRSRQEGVEEALEFDLLFGPAYKGILLAGSTAMTLSQVANKDVGFCFNRKEVKDHGEGGRLSVKFPRTAIGY